jgi:hypothetical protein
MAASSAITRAMLYDKANEYVGIKANKPDWYRFGWLMLLAGAMVRVLGMLVVHFVTYMRYVTLSR